MPNKSNISAGFRRLAEHGIKPSLQRLAIMDYLMEHRTHPTVDMIFSDLSPSMPTLSRTTVYNTLKLLVDKGVVLQITIDEKNCRYDAVIEPHTHFRCIGCDAVEDLSITPPAIDTSALNGCEITDTELYLLGYCPSCAATRRKE